jgi:Mitochondrial domain of unknown function (DUF1713)
VNIEKTINLPTVDNKTGTDVEKQAKNGMIMIRRRKMKKHKLRKLRKKMKYEWAKVSRCVSVNHFLVLIKSFVLGSTTSRVEKGEEVPG